MQTNRSRRARASGLGAVTRAGLGAVTRAGLGAFALAALGAGLLACQSMGGSGLGRRVAPADLAGSDWQVRQIGGRAVLEETSPTLRFESDGRVVGDAGCNRYNGPVSAEDPSALRFGPFAVTRRMCEADRVDQEQRLLETLERGGRLEQSGDDLYLVDAEGGVALALTRSTEPQESTP